MKNLVTENTVIGTLYFVPTSIDSMKKVQRSLKGVPDLELGDSGFFIPTGTRDIELIATTGANLEETKRALTETMNNWMKTEGNPITEYEIEWHN